MGYRFFIVERIAFAASLTTMGAFACHLFMAVGEPFI
jgi:hypothetical protein